MNTIDYLEKQYNHSFDMVKFGETKNTTLIAFNGAIIVGMTKLASDNINNWIHYYLYFVIAMSIISIFICISSLIAKIKHTTNNISLTQNDNLLFFATLAHFTPEQLIKTLKEKYGCENSNSNHENDLARQVIITSQIAARKFKLFNTAMSFTFCGILTPISLLIYKLYLDHDK